jgi:hypothetical protein
LAADVVLGKYAQRTAAAVPRRREEAPWKPLVEIQSDVPFTRAEIVFNGDVVAAHDPREGSWQAAPTW